MNEKYMPQNPRFGNFQIILLILVILIGLASLAPVMTTPSLAISSDNYIRVAERWKQSGIFPDTNYGPIYIIYVSLFPAGALGLRLLVLSQAFLSMATAWVVFAIARQLTSNAAIPAAAAMLWMLSPLRMIYQGLISTETLYVFLLYLAIYLFLRREHLLYLVAAGVVMGIAALTRGNCLIVGLVLALYGFRTQGWLKPRPALFAALFLAPVLLVSGNNYAKYGAFKPTASGDYNIATLIVGPEALGLEDGGHVNLWTLPGETFPNTFVEGRVLRGRALAFARQHPYMIVRANLIGYLKSISGSGYALWSKDWGVAGKRLAILGTLYRLAGYGLSLAWLAWWLFRKHPARIPVDPFLPILYLTLLISHIVPAGAAGYSRFSLPVDPVAILIAVMALQRLAGKLRGAGPAPVTR